MTRVALTTDLFETVAPAYRAAGLTPVALPCLQVEPADPEVLDRARTVAARADLLLLTSARTVVLLWPDREMPAVDVAAVGVATASAVEGHGGRVVARGGLGLADLVDVARHRLGNGTVAFPHAAGSESVALAELRRRCPNLAEQEVYRSVPIAPGAHAVEAVAFASPSAVRGWHLSRDLAGLIVGAIGPTTAAALTLWRQPDVTPTQPSHSALADALASHMEVSS